MIKSDLKLETRLWEEGYKNVAGVDEAGRGCWAGRVYAGVAIFAKDHNKTIDLTDSKLLTPTRREELFDHIVENTLSFGIGSAEADEIDTIGLAEAVRLAMERAIIQCESKMKENIDIIIVDGKNVRNIDLRDHIKEDKADQNHYCVAAASILAKVSRDRYMKEQDILYPGYDFALHKGYGTALHKQRLEEKGPSPIHRLSYKPVKVVAERYNFSRTSR